jgi:hypothetical protein
LPIEQVDACYTKHPGKFILVAALVIVIAENSDDGYVNVFKHGENAAHFFRQTVVCKVSGNDQHIGKIVEGRELVDIALVVFGDEVDVSDRCQLHSLLLVVLISLRGCG